MQAVKALYNEGKIELLDPIMGVSKAELYIIVLDDSMPSSRQDNSLLVMQAHSGFAQSVLADVAEEVWNDL